MTPDDKVDRVEVREWARTLLSALVILLLIGAIYGQVAWHDFVTYDDPQYITTNRNVKAGLTRDSAAWAFRSIEVSNWHPLTWLSHMADVELFGLDAGMHHLVNVGFHTANAVLLFLLFRGMTGKAWESAFVAALFAVHPLHVESVAWASERKDVLSTLFWWLTTWSYVGYARRGGAWRYGATAGLFALGLMSKPMLVTLPFTLLLLDWWPLGRVGTVLPRWGEGHCGCEARPLGRLVLEKVPLFLLSAASCVVTYLAQQNGRALGSSEHYPLWSRSGNAVLSVGKYAWKTVWPAALSVFYPHPAGDLQPRQVAAAGFFLLVGTAVALRWGRRAPYLPTGWFWFLGTLIPVLGLVQVGEQAMADRYGYVPLTGLFAAVVWGASDAVASFPRFRRSAVAAGVAALVGFSIVARVQAGYWRDTPSLFNHAIETSTEGRPKEIAAMKGMANYNLGNYFLDRENLPKAIDHYREAIRYEKFTTQARVNLGIALVRKGDLEGGEEQFRFVLGADAADVKAHINLGAILVRLGKREEGIRHLKDALRLQPGNATALENLKRARADAGR